MAAKGNHRISKGTKTHNNNLLTLKISISFFPPTQNQTNRPVMIKQDTKLLTAKQPTSEFMFTDFNLRLTTLHSIKT